MIKETPTFFDHLPGGIEASEVRGQSALVHSELLPVPEDRDRAMYEAMGVRFGSVVKDDPLFIEATLPAGWKKVATSHAMRSNVVDEKGRVRIHVFYKAAFYDRRATMSAWTRFDTSTCDTNSECGEPITAFVNDCDGTVRYASDQFFETNMTWNEAYKAANAMCESWLEAHYPDYKNPLAYWDVP
jgi:hypothetical protein